eukprot:evm.model.scf_4545.1 EVM.evm.TU.scf_4545.1   scf_4545:2303-4356(+)
MSRAAAALEAYGVQADRARAALEVVRGCRQAPPNWVDEALCWICDQRDLDEECQEMRQVMAQSLREQEERVKAEVAMEDKTHEELSSIFANSKVLSILRTMAQSAVLFSEPLKLPIVRFLTLEQKCTELWYPGVSTDRFFERLGQECLLYAAWPGAELAVTASPRPCSVSQCSSKKMKKKGQGAKRARRGGVDGLELPGGQRCGADPGERTPNGRGQLIEAIRIFLESKEQMILEAVSRMPLMSGETPSIFKSEVVEEDSGSDIEIVEVKPNAIETSQVVFAIE